GLETLLELHRQGTMSTASRVLRVSQSAVSKRISNLEAHHQAQLIQRAGRNVRLTDEGLRLVEKVSPLLSELRELMAQKLSPPSERVVLGVSESILSSWGAQKFEDLFCKLKVDVEYHCHRSPVVLEKVESGIYDVGICAGKVVNSRSLISESIGEEEMVLVSKSPGRWNEPSAEIICIENTSSTWRSIQRDVESRNLSIVHELESFFSVGQLALAGRGVGLIPVGVANVLGFKDSQIKKLRPKLSRPIQLVYKKSKLEQAHFSMLIGELSRLNL
ncbi:MAG: LysR family transcriptional regulator, partial [Bdellovibrionales bacterium]|nr:LysR family transcriptional regulator [Bdellovibrionales bacterium]